MARLPHADRFCIVARLMRMRFVLLPSAALIAVVLVGGAGCDEIDARRTIQKANGEYENARYETARDLYEDALKKSPDLEIGHHNLGVTYYRLMKRHDDSGPNQDVARKAARHLKVFLDKHPRDDKVRNLISDIFGEVKLYDEGIAFWQERIERVPDEEIFALGVLADFYYKKNDWQHAASQLDRKVEISTTANDKASAHLQIGQMLWSLLFEKKDHGGIHGEERVRMADRGIASLQKGLALEPSLALRVELTYYSAMLNQQRAIAAGSRLAYQVDLANYQNYMRSWSVLREEVKKQMEAEEAAKAEAADREAGAAP
jgi:tetratricopeptide (TPR) repeat protein